MNKDVLTTSQAAKLMGISVRTTQLLIESGALTSWKTPGGHRRVYRADVLAFISQNSRIAEVPSALVFLITALEHRRRYESLLSNVHECTVEAYTDVHTAAFAIGSHRPAAVVLDLESGSVELLDFLSHLAAHPALGLTQFIVVGGTSVPVGAFASARKVHVTSPEQLPEAVRTALHDGRESEYSIASVSYPLAANENLRLAALGRSGLLDTAPEDAFDRLTWLASRSLKAPIALMTMLTSTRQWFKSRVGLEVAETPRSRAFCNATILQRSVFAVKDLSRDTRFANNPAVTGSPHLRFYAGAPVLDADGFALGSLCVMDYEPRHLEAEQEQALLALAALASDEVRLRAADRQLRWTREALDRERRH
jgi:excisionase family DNA binding protein